MACLTHALEQIGNFALFDAKCRGLAPKIAYMKNKFKVSIFKLKSHHCCVNKIGIDSRNPSLITVQSIAVNKIDTFFWL